MLLLRAVTAGANKDTTKEYFTLYLLLLIQDHYTERFPVTVTKVESNEVVFIKRVFPLKVYFHNVTDSTHKEDLTVCVKF